MSRVSVSLIGQNRRANGDRALVASFGAGHEWLLCCPIGGGDAEPAKHGDSQNHRHRQSHGPASAIVP